MIFSYRRRSPDRRAFLGYVTRTPFASLTSTACSLAESRRHITAGRQPIGLLMGPYLTYLMIMFIMKRAPTPLAVWIIMPLASVLGWLMLSDALLYRRYVIIDFVGRAVMLQRRVAWNRRSRVLPFADIRQFVERTSTREYPSDDKSIDIDRLYLLAVELSDGRTIELLESTRPDEIESIAQIVETEAEDVPVARLDQVEESNDRPIGSRSTRSRLTGERLHCGRI